MLGNVWEWICLWWGDNFLVGESEVMIVNNVCVVCGGLFFDVVVFVCCFVWSRVGLLYVFCSSGVCFVRVKF